MISHSWPMIFKKPASKCFRDQIIFNQDPPGAFFLSRLPSQEHKRKPYDLYTFFSHRRFTYYTSRRNTSHPLQIIPKSYFKAPFHIALKKKEKTTTKNPSFLFLRSYFFKSFPSDKCLVSLDSITLTTLSPNAHGWQARSPPKYHPRASERTTEGRPRSWQIWNRLPALAGTRSDTTH